MRRHAFTLVEVMAVTVLLGVLASLGVPPMLRAMAGDPLERAAAQITLSFRDLRAQAYGHRLELDLAAWGFAAARIEDGGRATLPPFRLPETIQVSWTRRGRPVTRLEIDPRGHGFDHEVVLRQDEREKPFTIDGLTGRWTPKVRP
jgi:prepilin-type N-terminal cleavage/methylation domain-containing protein